MDRLNELRQYIKLNVTNNTDYLDTHITYYNNKIIFKEGLLLFVKSENRDMIEDFINTKFPELEVISQYRVIVKRQKALFPYG